MRTTPNPNKSCAKQRGPQKCYIFYNTPLYILLLIQNDKTFFKFRNFGSDSFPFFFPLLHFQTQEYPLECASHQYLSNA